MLKGQHALSPATLFAAKVLLVALAYYISGRLGLLLTIPPGYATAVWPASGIALAAVLLLGKPAALGVFFGSFAINVATGLQMDGFWSVLAALPVPAAIGLGAALQSMIGTRLIQHFVGYRNVLIQELEVVWMLMLGGPLACVVNATVGVTSLCLKGVIPTDNILINWWTWWVGDSIGVLVFTPLVLIWSLRPGQPWRRRQLYATLPLAGMFAIVVWLFIYISGQEQDRLQLRFASQCEDYVTRLHRDLRDDYQALYALSAFMREHPALDRAAFERFANSQLNLLVGIKSLSWITVVTAEQRAAFEAQIRAQGLPDFQIREYGPDGRLQAAGERAAFAPVTFLVPWQGNERASGFDDASEPVRAEALEQARRTGQPSASGPITLVQDGVGRRGLLIVLMVPRTHDMPLGYAIAAIRADATLEAAWGSLDRQSIEISAYERAARSNEALFYGKAAGSDGLHLELPVAVGGREWVLQFHQPAAWMLAHRSWTVWTLLAAGMLFTGLLGMFLLVMIGRSVHVEQLVIDRTAALGEANRMLAQEALRSQQLEGEARHRAEALAASNRELEQFAYVASHDLQAPLRNISSFARIIEKRYRDQLDTEANEFFGFIRESVDELQQLINDLLQLSKVNPQNASIQALPLGEAVRRAREQLRTVLEESHAEIVIEALPPVRGDLRLLTQLFQNLIGNAVKFQKPGAQPKVHIRAERIPGGDWRCEVSDNGIGIAPQHLGKLFQIFRRLHPADQYPGTGIGLALCQKIVGLHGGRIWVESTPGEGSHFYWVSGF